MLFSQFSLTPFCRKVALAACLILGICANASAQTSSTLTGDIKDTGGAALVGVQVTATSLDTGLTRSTTSEDEGRFAFPGLAVGAYEVRAQFAGFKHYVYDRINLTVNETATLNIVMEPAGL